MPLLSTIPDFETANPVYAGATATFYTVDVNNERTSTLATLYADPNGLSTAANPQVLDSEGKFSAPVYFIDPIIGEVSGPQVGSHETGVIVSPRQLANEAIDQGMILINAAVVQAETALDDDIAAANASFNATLALAQTAATNAANSASAAATSKTGADTAKAGAEAARDVAIAYASTVVPFEVETPAALAAITLPSLRKSLVIKRRSASGPLVNMPYKPGTSGGVQPYQDASGAWFEMDLSWPDLRLSPEMFGAVGDGVAYDEDAIASLNQALALGLCRSSIWTGHYRVYSAVADVASFGLISQNGIDGLTFEFVNARFTVVADQLALKDGVQWAGYFFYFLNFKKVRCIGIPRFVGNLTGTSIKPHGSAYGMIGFSFEGNCSGMTLDGVDADGILCPVYVVNDASTVMGATEKPVIAVKGTGYAPGNVLSLVGGGGSTAATFTVDTADGSGGVNGLSWLTLGNYPTGTLPAIGAAENGYALTGGVGTGARAYIYMQRASGDQHTSGGSAGRIKARNCFYGYVQRDSGDYLTAWVDADYCYRASFVYGGIIGARIFTTMRHIYRTAVIMGQAYHALGNQDCYFHIKLLQATESAYSSGDVICRPTFNDSRPTRVSTHVDVDLDYGNVSQRAPNFMEISKYNAGLADDVARGHDLKLKLTGRIKGRSDRAAAAVAGTHVSMAGYTWTGDHFGGWEVGPLDIEGGGDIIIDPRAFPRTGLPFDTQFANTKGGISFDVVNPDGFVTFNNALLGTEYLDFTKSRCAIRISSRSDFKNRHTGVAGAAYATIGAIDTETANINILPGWHDFTIKAGAGVAGALSRYLPSFPTKGLRYVLQNYGQSGTQLRFVPQVADQFIGQTVGKYLELAVGTTAVIECVKVAAVEGVYAWAVTSVSGSISYQP